MSFIKIDDIAKLSGYSKATVSKVINNYPDIPERTKEKILQIIREYDFQPNTQARNLAGKKDIVIGIFVFDKNGLYGSFFQEMSSLIIEKAERRKIKVLISIIKTSKEKLRIKQLIDNGTIQGGIILGVKFDEPEIENFVESGYKLVVFDYQTSHKSKNIFLVNSNNFQGGRLATKYLIDEGAKKILHMAGDSGKLAGFDRREGFLEEIKDKKVEYEILEGKFRRASAYEIFKERLKKGDIPEGVFCANDDMAIGCIEAIRECGIDLEKIKIVGFDNSYIAQIYYPKITSISYNLEKMAEKALEALIDMILGKEKEENIYNGEVKIHKRET